MMSTPREFIDAYMHAYEALDVEAFLALYADDARVFDSAEPSEYPSKAAWRGQVEGWFGSIERNGKAECGFEEIEIIEAAELAVINGHVTYEGTIVGTDEDVELESRATFVLQKFDDQWVIVHEHTSLPIEFDDDDDEFEDDDESDDDEGDDDQTDGGKLLGDQDDLSVSGEGHRGGLLGGSEASDKPTDALNQ